jgi:hypothetical protein
MVRPRNEWIMTAPSCWRCSSDHGANPTITCHGSNFINPTMVVFDLSR